MENYNRVRQPRSEEEHAENEVRVTSRGSTRELISYALDLFNEKNYKTITVRAMGQATSKAVAIAEIIKRRIEGLHQISDLTSVETTDVYEPKEEGLERIEKERKVSLLIITFSKDPLDTKHVGYQPPLPADQIKPIEDEAAFAGEDNGGGRGGYRGRGRGRGRGGRGGDGGRRRRHGGRGRGKTTGDGGEETAAAE